MAAIQVMNDHLANLIAAGEVVERPLNVVKECIENSIDAGAHSIEVSLKSGGIEQILIVDDGHGMDYEDVQLAFERHATSKLKKEADLFAISTMGFRGEALPSIASVAHVRLWSNNGQESSFIEIEYGQKKVHEKQDAPAGTRIEINNLFLKTPARFKFLKRASYEYSLIADLINKMALAHPDIRFVLRHDGRLTFQSAGKGDVREVFYQLFGKEIAQDALRFEADNDDYAIEGLAVLPVHNRANKYSIYLSVNHRLIRSPFLANSVIKGYEDYMPPGRYPMVYLNIDTDPQLIDVNVHPGKWQVRFSKEEELKNLIHETIEDLFHDRYQSPQGLIRPEVSPGAGSFKKAFGKDSSFFQAQPKPIQDDLFTSAGATHRTANITTGPKTSGSSFAVRKIPQDQAAQKVSEAGSLERTARDQDQSQRLLDQRANINTAPFANPSDQVSINQQKEEMARTDTQASDVQIGTDEREQQRAQAINKTENKAEPKDTETSREELSETVPEAPEYAFTEKASAPLNPGPEAEETSPVQNPVLETEFADIEEQAGFGNEIFDHLRVIGQLKESYILCEGPQGLIIIDQHAAQERYHYELLVDQMDQPESLLQPRIVPLQIQASAIVMEHIPALNEALKRYGLVFEPFGTNQLLLRAEPLWFKGVDQQKFLEDLLGYFETHQQVDMHTLRRHFLASIACHQSIRFHHQLTLAEMEQVVQDLRKCRQPFHCPHGRPTTLSISTKDLFKEFERG